MALLAFSFLLPFIWIAVEASIVVIGRCANLGRDLNVPKNTRVSGNVSSNLETSERFSMSLEVSSLLTFRWCHVIIIKS